MVFMDMKLAWHKTIRFILYHFLPFTEELEIFYFYIVCIKVYKLKVRKLYKDFMNIMYSVLLEYNWQIKLLKSYVTHLHWKSDNITNLCTSGFIWSLMPSWWHTFSPSKYGS